MPDIEGLITEGTCLAGVSCGQRESSDLLHRPTYTQGELQLLTFTVTVNYSVEEQVRERSRVVTSPDTTDTVSLTLFPSD